jgi:hypothetical protein
MNSISPAPPLNNYGPLLSPTQQMAEIKSHTSWTIMAARLIITQFGRWSVALLVTGHSTKSVSSRDSGPVPVVRMVPAGTGGNWRGGGGSSEMRLSRVFMACSLVGSYVPSLYPIVRCTRSLIRYLFSSSFSSFILLFCLFLLLFFLYRRVGTEEKCTQGLGGETSAIGTTWKTGVRCRIVIQSILKKQNGGFVEWIHLAHDRGSLRDES